jgi:hypothetical protein
MSAPRTPEEWARHDATQRCAGPAENVVSTACPECGIRFACLAQFKCWDAGDTQPYWKLRCVLCLHTFAGSLKPIVHDLK